MNRNPNHEFTALIVPCSNVQQCFDETPFIDFLDRHANIRLIFVDDGSEDQTLELLERVQATAQQDRVWILRLPRKCGRSEAIRRGVLLALSNTFLSSQDLSFIGILDDGIEDPLGQMSQLLSSIADQSEVDVVLARHRHLSGHSLDRKVFHKIADRMLAILAVHSLELPTNDIHCRVALVRYGRWLESVFCHKFHNRSNCDLEILARLKKDCGTVARRRVAEQVIEDATLNVATNQTLWQTIKASWPVSRIIFEHAVTNKINSARFDEAEALQCLVETTRTNAPLQMKRPRIFNPFDSDENLEEHSEKSIETDNHRRAA